MHNEGQSSLIEKAARNTAGDTRRSVSAGGEPVLAMQPSRWSGLLLLPQAVGVGARVAVWLGVFIALIFGMFTYPAVVMGGFLLAMLVFGSIRASRA